MSLSRWRPASLTRRFAWAAAGLAAAALLLTSIASWWLINDQHDRGLAELTAREADYRAAAVGSDLKALAQRISEIAHSTILATGLVDSAGRDTYLGPFLGSIGQINGIRVQVLFTDFQGAEIASNSGASFTPEQLAWLRQKIEGPGATAQIFASAKGPELVAMQPIVYPRTASPEGAVMYKVALREINVGPSMRFEWGPLPAGDDDRMWTAVPGPPIFQHLQFRVRGAERPAIEPKTLAVPYGHIAPITLALFAAVVIAGLQLARLLTLDLQRLDAFARRLLGSGLSTERAPDSGSSELANLARSINGMLDRLSEQHTALLQEREKLTQLTQVLRAADHRKNDFLAMLGHELRNPLAPISVGAELLRRIPSEDPRVVRTSEVIARQVEHMTKIINDLLDVSRVTRGLITLDKSEVDIAEVVATAVEQARPLIESRAHRFTSFLPDERALVLADRARLVQVVSNLLTNAAKYTPNGGGIELRVDATSDEVVVSVHDNGVGIPAELMPEIFDLFTQGSRAVDRTEGGLGLGLALVKHLVEAHGGSVTATSEGPGHGSAFTVRLPRTVASQAHRTPPPASAARATATPLEIMIVDDNADAAKSLAQLLSLEGHRVAIAYDGPTALTQAECQEFDVFILDIGLPGMDGMALARRLRAIPHGAHATLIAVTGYGQENDRRRAAEAGFDHHVVKPPDPDRLIALVGQAASARAQQHIGS